MLERLTRRRQLCCPNRQHHEHLLDTDLIGVIHDPNPIVGRLQRFAQLRHAQSLQPGANGCRLRHRAVQA